MRFKKLSSKMNLIKVHMSTLFKNEPFQRFKKGGRVAKSPFLEKSVQK